MNTTDTLVADNRQKDETAEQPKPQPKKWTSTAGPIQTSKVNKVLTHYSWVGNTYTELTGVIGRPETENRCTYTNLYGSGGRDDVKAAALALGEKFGWTITRANYQQIIDQANADFEELKKTTPVKDNRIAADVHDAREAAYAVRQAKEREEREVLAKIKARIQELMPSSAGAIIMANQIEDDSEPQADYGGSKTLRRVVIGFRFGSREDFRQLRDAAARFEPTKHLATGPAEFEHRENWSMGHGYYLKDGGRYSTGWEVKATTLSGIYGNVEIDEEAIKATPPFSASPVSGQTGTNGVTVSLNDSLGGVEVRFPSKPAQSVIDSLKMRGFRWSMRSKCWYKKQSPAAIEFANSLAGGAQEAPKVEEKPAETPDPFDLAVEDRMAEAAGVACEQSLFGDQ